MGRFSTNDRGGGKNFSNSPTGRLTAGEASLIVLLAPSLAALSGRVGTPLSKSAFCHTPGLAFNRWAAVTIRREGVYPNGG